MVALDVPPEADKRAVHGELLRGAADGSWEWQEGRIDDEWEVAKVAREKRRWPRWRDKE